MDDFQLLIDLHKPNLRLGPGSEAATRLALELSGLLPQRGLTIADVGCGTGAATLTLAEHLDAQITAVDIFPDFLAELTRRAQERGVSKRIQTLRASMAELPFDDASLDAIWSEGAIYNIGFESGVKAWRPCLKHGGVLAVSELTWLTSERPAELQAHWDQHYPQVDVASAKIAVLEKHGFTPIGYFPLDESCWIQHYYHPLQTQFPNLLNQYDHSPAAHACVDAEAHEIALYEKYKDHVSYGFYVARKTGG